MWTSYTSLTDSNVKAEEPDLPDLSDLDVDHLMPRSWVTHWPLADGTKVTGAESATVELLARSGAPLGERQKQINDRQAVITTLGNLSLLNLSVNREARHFDFTKKRELLIANTNLRLNIPLISLTVWDEAAIGKRGEQLANAALKIWSGPRP